MITFRKGDRVRAVGRCVKTERKWSMADEMRALVRRRTVMTVVRGRPERDEVEAAEAGPGGVAWSWHPADLRRVGRAKARRRAGVTSAAGLARAILARLAEADANGERALYFGDYLDEAKRGITIREALGAWVRLQARGRR